MIWWTVIHLGLSKADSFDSCWCLQNSRKRKLSQTGVEQTFSAWHWPKSIAHRFHRSWCIWNVDGLGITLWISNSCCLKFSNPWLMFPDITFSIQLKLTDNSPNPQLTSHHSTWYVSVQLRLMHKSPNPQLTPFHGTLGWPDTFLMILWLHFYYKSQWPGDLRRMRARIYRWSAL